MIDSLFYLRGQEQRYHPKNKEKSYSIAKIYAATEGLQPFVSNCFIASGIINRTMQDLSIGDID
jgi:hypothetical protein